MPCKEEGGQPPGPAEAAGPREGEEGAASKEEKTKRRREKYERERKHNQRVKEKYDCLCAELDTRRQVRG